MAVFDSLTKDRIARSAARIDPNSRAFQRVTMIIGLLSFTGAFLVSGNSLFAAGLKIGLSVPMALALPVAIDASMVVFSLSAIARKARGQSVKSAMASLLFFSLASIATNAWHSLSLQLTGIDLWGSLLIAAVIPIAVITTSHAMLGILIAPPAHVDPERLQREARAVDRAATASAGSAPARPKRGTAEYADRQADIRDRKRTPGTTAAALQREGFSMTEITAAGSQA